jgi:hypothetical protein
MLIRDRLKEKFPEDACLGEETGRTEFASGQGIWVVDPIDGTQPFINGLTGWCVPRRPCDRSGRGRHNQRFPVERWTLERQSPHRWPGGPFSDPESIIHTVNNRKKEIGAEIRAFLKG